MDVCVGGCSLVGCTLARLDATRVRMELQPFLPRQWQAGRELKNHSHSFPDNGKLGGNLRTTAIPSQTAGREQGCS